MRSLLGRFHRPMSRGLVNNMLTMNNLGDGSTLSLDFTTMGDVLDPRLTFSRASTATFVNSSGYVEYAGANLLLQSETISTSPWVDQNGATRLQVSITNPIGGATSTQVTSGSASNAISQGPTYQAGLPHIIRIWVRAGTSSQLQLGVYAGGFVTGTISVISGTATVSDTGLFLVTGLTSTWTQLQIVYPSLTGSGAFLIYPDTASPVAGRTIYVWGAQLNPGSTVQTYYPTTTAAYHAPRFDYSPTNIGQPRGLLVEGQAVNLTTYSEDFANINWTKDNSGGFLPVVTTVTATTPANGASVNQIVFDKTGGLFSRIQRTSAGTASTPYTMSVWMRTVSGSANVGLRIGADPAGFNCAVTTTWKRFQYTYTLSSTDSSAQIMLWDNIIGNDETATVYVWGCQVEAGSGASSYIPTGASGVTRNADNCYIYDATTLGGLSWFKTATQGTIYVEAYKRTAGTTFAGALHGTRATSTQDFMLYQAIGNNWLSLNWGASEYVTNYSTLSSPFLIKSAVAWSPGSPTTKADSTVSINGSNSALNTTPNIALPFASDLFCIGSRGSAGGSVPTQNYADTAIRSIKFYPFAMTAAQMNTLTTL